MRRRHRRMSEGARRLARPRRRVDPAGAEELAANIGTPEMYQQLDEVKWDMLEEWSKTKRAPKHAAWMHEKEFR